jgi:hypothetical protein
MDTSQLPLILLLALSSFMSCGGGSGGDSKYRPQEEQDSTPTSNNVILDSELSDRELSAMKQSTEAMKEFEIDGSKIRSFSQIFEGNSSDHVDRYFQRRINYTFSESTDITDRLVIQSLSRVYFSRALASNPSVFIWLLSKVSEPEDLKIEINDSLIDINSSRIGTLQLAESFTEIEDALQAITLVHEARHSDCPGGTVASDIERFQEGEIPLNLSCGHLHAECPEGHPYEGINACDIIPWGAYLVDALYSAAIYETCQSCSETQRQVAEINFLDVIQRPLYDIVDLLDGEFGPPDMSSSNSVR